MKMSASTEFSTGSRLQQHFEKWMELSLRQGGMETCQHKETTPNSAAVTAAQKRQLWTKGFTPFNKQQYEALSEIEAL